MTIPNLKSLGDYELTELLRSIADTEYYVGYRQSDSEKVLVKTSPLRPGTEEFDRMALELRVLASLSSDYIAPLLDAGHDSGVLYAVFPHLLPTSTNSDTATTVGLVSDAARGAHELHEAGIVHRNIQPQSILQSNGRGVLGDLGMLRSLNPSEATKTIGPIGSPHFSDPDLLCGSHRGSRRSDIWSLGATLHYMLTGKHIVGELPNGAVQEVLKARLSAKISIEPSLPDDIASIIKNCVEPEHRYATSDAVSKDLDQIKGAYV